MSKDNSVVRPDAWVLDVTELHLLIKAANAGSVGVRPASVAQHTACEDLYAACLIKPAAHSGGSSAYVITELGRAHLTQLLRLPLPERFTAWKDPKGEYFQLDHGMF